MGHSKKTDMLSQTDDYVTARVACGESRNFKTDKEGEIWISLHKKRCNDCKSIKSNNSGKTVYNNGGMHIIDLENKQKSLI
jgi:hypothetical protein